MNDLDAFILRLKCLHNVDGYTLEPHFSLYEQMRFCRNPVRYLLTCDDADRAIIWRALEARYQPQAARRDAMRELGA